MLIYTYNISDLGMGSQNKTCFLRDCTSVHRSSPGLYVSRTVSVKPVCGVLSIKPPAAACNNLFMGSLCFRAPLQWYFKIQQNNNKKWHPTTNYNKRGNILITNFRSNIFISGVISPSGGAIFLWRQYSYQGRQYSYQLYNMRFSHISKMM